MLEVTEIERGKVDYLKLHAVKECHTGRTNPNMTTILHTRPDCAHIQGEELFTCKKLSKSDQNT